MGARSTLLLVVVDPGPESHLAAGEEATPERLHELGEYAAGRFAAANRALIDAGFEPATPAETAEAVMRTARDYIAELGARQ